MRDFRLSKNSPSFRKISRLLSRGLRLLLLALLIIGVRGLSVFRADDGTTAQQAQSQSGSAQEVATTKKPTGETGAEPLLLDDSDSNNLHVEGMADNSRCQVCHLNLVTEELALKHARAGVGCAKCHGESDAHIADESWASGGNGTPPDIMFPRDKIAIGCMSCHNAEQVFVKAEKHKPDAWLIAYEVKTCTECHGKHRLPSRKCKWKIGCLLRITN